MPAFENAQNVDASGGTFNDVGRDQHNLTNIHGDQIFNYTVNREPGKATCVGKRPRRSSD